MSAFICSKHCFELILSGMYDHFDIVKRNAGKRMECDDNDDAIKSKLVWFGNELRKMNVKSYNARYGERIKNKTIDFDVVHMNERTTDDYLASLACIIKQIHCLKYQSCEFDNCEGDWRWKALTVVEHVLLNAFVRATNQYEECKEWG